MSKTNLFDEFTEDVVETEEVSQNTMSASEEQGLSDEEIKQLRNLATTNEVPYEKALQYYNEVASEPFFAKMKDKNKRFRMIRALIKDKFERAASLKQVDIFLVGKTSRFITSKKHIMTQAIVVTTEKSTGESVIRELSSYEPYQESAWRNLFATKNGYSYTVGLQESKQGNFRLTESSYFNSEVHPSELDEDLAGVSDAEIVSMFTGKVIHSTVEDAGLSATNDKGFPIVSDFKLVRLVLGKPSEVFKVEEVPDLFKYRFSATDEDGESVVVTLTSYPEFEHLATFGGAFFEAVVVGVVSEWQGEKRIEALNIIPVEYGED